MSLTLFTSIKDWQTLIAAIIVMIGWFINSWLNKRHEIAKRRSEHRLTALKSFVGSILFELSKGADIAFKQSDFKEKLESARVNIQMYGFRNEIEIYENFINAINKQDIDAINANQGLKIVKHNIHIAAANFPHT